MTIIIKGRNDMRTEERCVMKKVYLLKGLACPNCLAQIEREVGALDGVTYVTGNMMNQTLTLCIDASLADQITMIVEKIVHKHEPQIEILDRSEQQSDAASRSEEKDDDKKQLIRLVVGAFLYGLGVALRIVAKLPFGVELSFLIIAYVILGGDVVLRAVRNIGKGRVFDENFLMSLSTIGAFVIGEYPEAVAVMLFYQIGEFFQNKAVKRSRKSIASLLDIRPDFACVKRNGQWMRVSPEEVLVGEQVMVKAGERIPIDGLVVEGEAMLDTRALTGESIPRRIHEGERALSGCINQSGRLIITVTKEYGASTATKMIDLVEHAASKKAPTENFITTFSRYYTPVIVICAVFLAVIPPLIFGGAWADWISRGFVFLVISCPCALVISIPLSFFGGIGAASKRGVLVKGSNYLETLNHIRTVVFDKTGTLTKGVFCVTEILPEDDSSAEKVLEYAAKAESFSNHPIGRSILNAYEKEIEKEKICNYQELSGRGICVQEEETTIFVGNEKLMEHFHISYTPCTKVGTKVYVAVNETYVGCIIIADEVKQDSKKTIAGLKHLGVQKTVMLTGDNKRIATAVAKELGLDAYEAELLPEQKVAWLEKQRQAEGRNGKIAFVGDGLNDAPVLALADIGIAMGGLGSDAAIEAADVVLMTDEPSKLLEAIDVAKTTKQIVVQNIVIALGVKVVFLVLGMFGIAGMWEAVFGDVGVMMIAVLNAMRILKK